MSLIVSDLTVGKGGKPIVGSVDFTAPAGAITGLIGPNGAGKSTLLSALLGLVPASGAAHFAGHELMGMKRRERARKVAFVEQSATTEERLSVTDVVALGRIPFEAAWQAEPTRRDRTIIGAALEETGMTGFAARRFDTLSGGEQQRVHLARALAQEPQLLLLDEPTSHLDIGGQLQLLALLRRKAETGMTVVLALHDLNLAARFCDHLVVLAAGKRAAEGPPEQVLNPPLLEMVYGVRARLVADPQARRPIIVYDEATQVISPQIPD